MYEKRKYRDMMMEQGVSRQTVAKWFRMLRDVGRSVWEQNHKTAGKRFKMLVKLLRKRRGLTVENEDKGE